MNNAIGAKGSSGAAFVAPVDYSHLTGTPTPAVRMDPHTHVIASKPEQGLLRLVELVRIRPHSETEAEPSHVVVRK